MNGSTKVLIKATHYYDYAVRTASAYIAVCAAWLMKKKKKIYICMYVYNFFFLSLIYYKAIAYEIYRNY
jgi:hypothetical protein